MKKDENIQNAYKTIIGDILQNNNNNESKNNTEIIIESGDEEEYNENQEVEICFVDE